MGAGVSMMEAAFSILGMTSSRQQNAMRDVPKRSLTWAAEARLKQVEEVGSEVLYKRLDKKMANLEVDHFFYRKQLKLFRLRYKILGKITRYNMYEKSYICSQSFDQVLEDHHHQNCR